MNNNWLRVSRSRPCPICKRPDWCLQSADGGAAICARVQSGKKCGAAGWLHRLRDTGWRPSQRIVRSVPIHSTSGRNDLADLAARFQMAFDLDQLHALARSLGLSVEALKALGIGWSANHRAWSFPMVDVAGNVLGIRLRRANGFKFAVTGSRDGLFVPTVEVAGLLTRDGSNAYYPQTAEYDKPCASFLLGDHGIWKAQFAQRPPRTPTLLVAEGPTDVAALWDMGFRNVVGRPSCTGGVKLLVDLVRRRQASEVVIIGDGDDAGQLGADHLASVLLAYTPAARVIRPSVGAKDARQWLQQGGNKKDVEQAIASTPARRLAVCSRRV